MSRYSESALVQLTLSRLRMFFREPSSVFWTFAFPILLTFALGTAFRTRPPEPVYVAVEDHPGAEKLRAALAASGGVRAEVMDAASAEAARRTGKVTIVVVPGAADGHEGARTYRFDPTRPESRLARAVVDDVLQRAEGRRDPTTPADVTVATPGSRYVDFLVPGLLGMSILTSGLWGIGYLLVDLRTRKLIKRMVATPMRKVDFLLSFILMRMSFLVLEIPVLLCFARFAFGVRLQGSTVLFAGLALLGALAFSGLGLLVASRTDNTQTVAGLINVVSLPMMMCSGVFFSTARFPAAMQPLVRALPLTTLNDALRAVMNDGAGLRAVAMPALILAGWTVASFLTALRVFRWR